MNKRKRGVSEPHEDVIEKKTLAEEVVLSNKKKPELEKCAKAGQSEPELKDWIFYGSNCRISTWEGRRCRATSLPPADLMAMRSVAAVIARHAKVGWVTIARVALYSNDWTRFQLFKQTVKAPEFWLELCRHDTGSIAQDIPFGPNLTRLDVLLAAVSSFACGYCGLDDLWSSFKITADQNHALLFNTWIDRALDLKFVETETSKCGTVLWIEDQPQIKRRVFEINPVTNRPVFIAGERQDVETMPLELCDQSVKFVTNSLLSEFSMAENHVMKMFVFLERIGFNEFLGLYWERKSRPRSPFPVLIDRLFSVLCGRFSTLPIPSEDG